MNPERIISFIGTIDHYKQVRRVPVLALLHPEAHIACNIYDGSFIKDGDNKSHGCRHDLAIHFRLGIS
jgi:hypothetical protein